MPTRRLRARPSLGSPKRKTAPKQVATSRERLLRAARFEFAAEGLRGARVDAIARRAKMNKQLIYYHFGDKDALYLAVLEDAYSDIRERERDLNLSGDDPVAAITKLVGFTFDYVCSNREFVRLLINENLLDARFVRRSKLIRKTGTPIVGLLRDTVARGAASGLFRADVDPVQLYISMAGLCFFYIGNIHTLTVLFERDFDAADQLAARREHVIAFVLGYLSAQSANPRAARAAKRRG